jgi:hypothetical protein
MSLRHPSRTSRRLLKIASLGLAGLIAGLLTGCNPNEDGPGIFTHVDTDWRTPSTYASATASAPPSSASHNAHTNLCYSASCNSRSATTHTHLSHHHGI